MQCNPTGVEVNLVSAILVCRHKRKVQIKILLKLFPLQQNINNTTTKSSRISLCTIGSHLLKMPKCRSCEQPLVIELDPESFDEATSSSVGQASSAPDDLLLRCGCHFHWYVKSLCYIFSYKRSALKIGDRGPFGPRELY